MCPSSKPNRRLLMDRVEIHRVRQYLTYYENNGFH